MKKILGYLLDYQRKHFDAKLYATFAVFMALCIFFNYRYDFEDSVIDNYTGQSIKWLWMFLFHVFPYLAVCTILLLFKKVPNWTTNGQFWLKLCVGFGLLALDRSFFFMDYFSRFFPDNQFWFLSRCIFWVKSLFVMMLPMLVVYLWLEKDDNPKIFYGLSWRKFDPAPYAIMLLIAAVFLAIGSFLGEIQEYYPRFQHAYIHPFVRSTGWEHWQAVLLYEVCYGTDFISVELFFRGFLIFAFVRILGPYVVLPMISTYCFLHFGKPLGESVSSLFGGYILGIISMNSRNVWGGIFIHLGVAWLMELFGWLQNS
jgi:hypothetical protein